MAQVTDTGFIVIDNQVAMPEETLCALLDTTPRMIEKVVPLVGMKYEQGGIYFRDGKYYFASPEAVFRIYNYGNFQNHLSPDVVIELFKVAEKRLLLSISDEQLKKFATLGLILMGMVAFLMLLANSPSPSTKTEQTVQRPAETFYSTSYNTIEKMTGRQVTEKWMFDFFERVTPNGRVETHGFVELNGDGIKRQFWLTFDEKSRRLLRIKVGPDLIYLDFE